VIAHRSALTSRKLARHLAAPLLFVVAAAGAWGPGAPPARAASRAKLRVAVLDFTDAAPEAGLAALGKGLQSMLTTDLGAVGVFEMIERARVAAIRAELKLGRSGLVDRRTAARVGKLLGATHLVAGSFTVMGGHMRLDARLFAVRTGKVLTSAAVEGERDAFFELEKDLARKLVAAAGVKPAPKERAQMARIHTADFQAFRAYSDGLAAFDAKRMDEALARLQEATRLDGSFTLAKVTLADYERVVAQARGRADAARVAQEEAARQARARKVATEGAIVDELLAVAAGRRGVDPVDRAVALRALAQLYGTPHGASGPLQAQRDTGDNFALQRTADRFYAAYYAVAGPLFPKLAPTFPGTLYPPPPADAGDFRGWFAQVRKRALGAASGFAKYPADEARRFGERLHLDRRGIADLARKLYELGRKTVPGDCRYLRAGTPARARCLADWRARSLDDVAEAYRAALALDESTRAWEAASKATEDPAKLEDIAEELAVNRDLARAVRAPGPDAAALRELLMLDHPGRHGLRRAEKLFPGGRATERAWRALDHARTWWRHPDEYLILGGQPCFARQGARALRTGPRSDPWRADAVRYLRVPPRRPRRKPPVPALIVVGDRPSADAGLSLGATVSRRLPPDLGAALRPDDRSRLGAIPADAPVTVSFLFGLRDVDARSPYDRATRTYPDPPPALRTEAQEAAFGQGGKRLGAEAWPRHVEHPGAQSDAAHTRDPKPNPRVGGGSGTYGEAHRMRGYAVRVSHRKVRLVAFREVAREGSGDRARRRFADEELAAWSAPGATRPRVDVSVRVAGPTVRVAVGSARWKATLPEAPTGFAGIAFEGDGFAAVEGLAWRVGAPR